MMVAMKIYTKTGDDGTTGVFGGGRVRKCDARIDCYGAIDELNAALGLARVLAEADRDMALFLQRVQGELFVIGSHLATPEDSPSVRHLPMLDEQMVSRLEMEIDMAEAQVEPLRNFILPGGSELAARLHLARTVCRRAERAVVEFSLDRPVSGVILTYLNRLSDWLFVMARLANRRAGVADIIWEGAE
jgi:cob(I)alamin adenosyltransferase